MNSIAIFGEIVRVTLRQLLGRRRTLLLVLLSALPVLLAVAFRMGGETDIERFTRRIFDTVTLTILLPLVAILFGAGAFGAEIDDGTVVHLLAKPVGRGWIILAKMLVAGTAGVLLCGTSTLVAGLLLVRLDSPALLLGMLAGVVLSVIAYTAVFVTLSVWTGRALIAGLAYVLLWEGLVATFFSGTRLLSIREYGLDLAAGIAGPEAGTLARDVPLVTGLVLAIVVTVLAFWLGARRLARFEISDAG